MKSVLSPLFTLALFFTIFPQIQAQPVLSSIKSDAGTGGTARLPGLVVDFGYAPVLTFSGSNFSSDMSARFSTIDLMGVESTRDFPLSEIVSSGDADSAKITLDGSMPEHVLINSGPVWLVDNTNTQISANDVDIVIIPSLFSLLETPNDFYFGGDHNVSLGEGILYLEGVGFKQNSLVVKFVRSPGDTAAVTPDAVGSVTTIYGGDEAVLNPDTLGEGLLARLITPAGITDSVTIIIETTHGISEPLSFRRPRIENISRRGGPIRGVPANQSLLSANVGDTLLFDIAGMGRNIFPEKGTGVSFPGESSFLAFDSISADTTRGWLVVPDRGSSGKPVVSNEVYHILEQFSYFFPGDSGEFVQVVPTLDTLVGALIAPGANIRLQGSGLRQSPVVKFSRIGGGTIDINESSNFTGTQISVPVPDDAAPGPLYVETPGGTSDTLQLVFKTTPLEIMALALEGIPADTAEASANFGQTFTVVSEGILPDTRLVIKSPSPRSFIVQNISPDSTTAEVLINSVSTATGLARLENTATQTISELKLLQIVPTFNWVSSGAFAGGSTATLHGTVFERNATNVTVTDSLGGAVTAEVINHSANWDEVTIRLPDSTAAGLVQVSTPGGSDTLTVRPPEPQRLTVSADIGTPADTALPSANIGQVMMVEGTGFSASSVVRFLTIDQFGTERPIDFELLNVSANSEGEVVIGSISLPRGLQIASGLVRIGESHPSFPPLVSGRGQFLQIVPRLAAFDVADFLPGEIATIRGTGLIEGKTTVYFSDSLGGNVAGELTDVIGNNNNELTVTLPGSAVPDALFLETDGGTSLIFDLLPPQIIGISPESGVRGSLMQLTTNGENFSIGSVVSFSGSNAAVDTTVLTSPNVLTSVLRIAPTAATGVRDVIVTNPSGTADTLFNSFMILADTEFPQISNLTQLPNTGDTTANYVVQASISDNIAIQNAFLVYSTDHFLSADSMMMDTVGSLLYQAQIPAQPLGTSVNYFVSAYDLEGNRSTSPADAPDSSLQFQVLAIPVFDMIGTQFVDEGNLLQFSISATDPDNDPIIFSAENLPAGANFTDTTFSWTPNYQQSGNHLVTFTADDNDDGAANLTVTITVTEVTDPPNVLGAQNRLFFAGQFVEISLSISDPDGDPINTEYLNLPPGAEVIETQPGSSLRYFQWQTTSGDTGNYRPKFIADDGLAADTLEVSLQIVTATSPIIESLSPRFGHVDDLITLKGLAFGSGSGAVLFNGAASPAMVSGDTMATAIVPQDAISGPLLFIAENNTVSESVFFTVLPPPTVNLAALSLESSVPLAVTGATIALTAEIKNEGLFTAEAELTFYDHHPDSGGTAISSALPFEIRPGQRLFREFDWIPQSPGAFVPHVRISGSDPRENRLTDNTIGDGGIIVAERGVIEPEIVHIVAPPAEFTIGEPKNYSIKLMNSGFETAQITQITFDGNFGFLPMSGLPISLPQGIVKNVDITVTVPSGTAPGGYVEVVRLMTANGIEFSGLIHFNALENNPEVTVRLLNDDTTQPVPNARVFTNGEEQQPTDSNGEFTIEVPPGISFDIVFFKDGFLPARIQVSDEDAGEVKLRYIDPGEILVTNVTVEPLSSEEIANLGIDLSSSDNFNFLAFSAAIQFSADQPPMEVEWVTESGGGGSGPEDPLGPCGMENVISSTTDLVIKDDEDNCGAKFLKRTTIVCESGKAVIRYQRMFCSLRRIVRERGCDPAVVISEYEEMKRVMDQDCTVDIVELCTDHTPGGHCSVSVVPDDGDAVDPAFIPNPAVSGSAEIPAEGVIIPYVIAINGTVRSLKDFFEVTFVVGNQADPSFTVTDLNVEFLSPDVVNEQAALTVVKDADPLPDIAGGQSANANWIVRGDAVGTHTIQIELSAALQPGNIPISATQLALVTVTEPPELHMTLQHPSSISNGDDFILSAIVENLSEQSTARSAGVEIFLGGESTAQLLSPALQELGDIPPGESRTASWEVLSMGEGEIFACNGSSGDNLAFTLQIGGTPCDDIVPADTTMDDDAPPGKVVILGSGVGVPDVRVSALGRDKDNSLVTIVATTNDNGEYKFSKRVSDMVQFFLTHNDLQGQGLGRPSFLRDTLFLDTGAGVIPDISFSARNQYDEMTALITALTDTATFDPFFNIVSAQYLEEEQLIIDFLAASQTGGLWGENLQETREEFYRLYLGQRLISHARLSALQMARPTSEALFAAIPIILSYAQKLAKVEDRLAGLIGNRYGDRLEEITRLNLQALQDATDQLYQWFPQFAEAIIRLAFAEKFPDLAESISARLAALIRNTIGIGVSYLELSEKIEAFMHRMVLQVYALETDGFIDEIRMNAESYPGPADASALTAAIYNVFAAEADISTGVTLARTETEFLLEAATLFGDISGALDSAMLVLDIAMVTPAAPIAANIRSVVSKIIDFADILQAATTGEAIKVGGKEVFINIPLKIHRGVNQAFDKPVVLQKSPFAVPQNRALKKTQYAVAFNTGILENLNAAFSGYRAQLQAVRGHITTDAIAAALDAQTENFLPADQLLSASLSPVEQLLDGGARNQFLLDGTDDIFTAYKEAILDFNVNRLTLPWSFIHYAVLGEAEGGVTNPGYAAAKQDMIDLLNSLNNQSEQLQNILTATVETYEMQSVLPPTAIVDSVWYSVEGIPFGQVRTVPAKIEIHAIIQNLSAGPLTNLAVTLRRADIANYSFSAGTDSMQMITEIAADDNANGGADKAVLQWELTYNGELTTGRQFGFSVILESDSADVFTGDSPPVYLNFQDFDADGDDMPDSYEMSVLLNPNLHDAAEDPDEDQLQNIQEYYLGSDPFNPDSDLDGISDGVELTEGSDPLDNTSPVNQNAAAFIMPQVISVGAKDILDFPIRISSSALVTAGQFTIDYDSTKLVFRGAEIDSGLFSFVLDSVETDPDFPPTSGNANKNLLLGFSSENNTVSGNGIAIAQLHFEVTETLDSAVTITFDRRAENTYLINQDQAQLTIAAFSDLTISPKPLTAIETSAPAALPTHFDLAQNYPNPFNPTTTIN